MRRQAKLRYRLTAMVLLLLAATLAAVTAITHGQSLSVIRRQAFALNSKLVDAGAERLETEYSQLNSLFQSIYLNEDFKELLRHRGSGAAYADAALTKAAFLSVLSSRKDLYSIIYVDEKGRLFYTTRDEAGYYDSYLSCSLPEEYVALLENSGDWEHGLRLMPTSGHMPLRHSHSGGTQVYAAARRIVNTEQQFAPAGVMFITIDLSELGGIAGMVRAYDSAVTYISASDGRVIFDSSGALTGGMLPEALSSCLGSGPVNEVQQEPGKYIMVSSSAEGPEWYLLSLIPESVYTADALSVSTVILITAAVALAIAAAIAAAASRAISRPVEALAEAMDSSGIEDLSQRVPVQGTDEIARLGTSFNRLMDDLESSIQREYIMNLRQKDAVIRALQAQLDPHFLYNVLQSIGSIALVNDIPEISTITTSLGSMLRYSIKGEGTLATVREELEHVRSYLAIQKIRFQDRLDYIIDVPECVMDGLLPRVSLQPMVENAIIHGFEPRSEPGTICVRSWLEGDTLVIEVSDDGQGMSAARLDAINRQLAGDPGLESGPAVGIGISNLNARLKLLYEQAGELRIESEEGIGTVLQIRVPFVRR